MTNIALIVFFTRASSSLGEWYKPDKDIAGMRFKELQKTSEFCYLTSKGRELEWRSREHYIQDLTVKRLKNHAGALKGEGERTVQELQLMIESGEQELADTIEEEKKIQAWLEVNCVSGTSLYYYDRRSKNHHAGGYCIVKEGVVINSFILGEDPILQESAVPALTPLSVGRDESDSWLTYRLKWHRHVQADGPKDLVVIVSVISPKVELWATECFVKNSGEMHGWQLTGHDLRGHGDDHRLGETTLRRLRTLLAQLPAPQPRNPAARYIVSFRDGGRWETSVYRGDHPPDVLQQIFEIVDFGDRGKTVEQLW